MKRALAIFKSILTYLVVITSVGTMLFTIITMSTVNRHDRSFFGYQIFIVLSNSMKATDFEAGDLVVAKKVDPRTLEVGDIITFQSANPDIYGSVITHKIREIREDNLGYPVFVTYGTTTNIDDLTTVSVARLLGKYQFRIPGVGKFIHFLKTVPGYILCIFLPFFILIVLQGIEAVRIFRAYRKEQLEELESEREKLRQKHEETMKLMEEIKLLREELVAKKSEEDIPKE